MEIRKKLSILVFLGLTAGNAEASLPPPSPTMETPINWSVFPVNSSNAIAEAAIDWSSFSVTGYALGLGAAPSIHWNSQNTSVSARTVTPDATQMDTSGDWITSLSKIAGNSATGAQADGNTSILRSQAYDTNLSASAAWSNSGRQGSFTVFGSGFLVFSVGYTLDASLVSGNGTIDYAETGVHLEAQKTNSAVNNQSFVAQDIVTLSPSNADNSPVHQSGILQLALLVNNGEQFNFTATNYANASVSAAALSSVPLPGAAWLFLSALVGCLGLNRRQSRLTA